MTLPPKPDTLPHFLSKSAKTAPNTPRKATHLRENPIDYLKK